MHPFKGQILLNSAIRFAQRSDGRWQKKVEAGFVSKKLLGVILFLSLAVVGIEWRGGFINAVLSQDKAPASRTTENQELVGVYKDLPVNSGVWNNGRAAIWDLLEIEHFQVFGPSERATGYRPEQPIKFSHVTHVQKNKMDCQYCHWSVAKAAYAAIPEVQTCMGCHAIGITGKDEEQKKEIAKIADYYKRGEPIPWVKVHVMPQHVGFNHKRHVKAGITCQQCHGIVPNMPVVERVTSMKMGWCIDCHRQKGSSIDCWTCHK